MKTGQNLHQDLIEYIRKKGAMPLGKFIDTAMTHERFGYYRSAHSHPLGASGDFITAPEISQMFGEMIAAWIIDLWQQMGRRKIRLIECGPGRGTLMADILRIGQKVPEFHNQVQIRLIETSRALKEIQKDTLEPYRSTVHIQWHESLSQIEAQKGHFCVIIGNEFLDALPIEQLIRRNGIWKQRTIDVDTKDNCTRLCFVEKKMDSDLHGYLPPHARDNEIYEISPQRIEYIKNCFDLIKQSAGAALFIDYGHTQTSPGDTLQAISKHRFSDVLEKAGRSDITAHVDFAALERCIKEAGGACKPVITQRAFLRNIGIEHRACALKEAADQQGKNNAADIQNDLERLIAPAQMGELFKVFCFYSDKNAAGFDPCGF
ncbi:MAG: class I SAM-dependent methyltransferase [Alphaproteobacteria bacterium]